MDSGEHGRYPQGMRFLRLLVLLAALAAPLAQAADPPVVAVLEYPDGWLFVKRAKILLQTGLVTSPLAHKPQVVWTLKPGDTLKQDNPPAERMLVLYQGSGNEAQVVCTITVHYSRTGSGWQPRFLINPQPLVIWDGKKPVPVASEDAARGEVRVLRAGTSDGEGFAAGLQFGRTDGPVAIDAWELQ